MELENIITDKIVFGGNCIGKIHGKNVFVPYAVPSEELEIRITEQKNDYDNAEIVNILKASEHRVKPECAYYGICGGCNMMHIDSEAQTEYRKEMLYEMLTKNGVEYPLENIKAVTGPSTGYRSRFQLTDGGLSEKRKNTIIPITECLCAEKPVNKYLAETPFDQRPDGRIHFFGSEKALNQDGTPAEMPFISQKKEEKVQKIIQSKKSSKKYKFKENRYFAGTAASPENEVTVQISDKKLTFDVRGFFQSNMFVFEKTCNLIREKLTPCDNILDMYSGCGSLSAFAADKAGKVTLVEHNRDALVFAERNMAGTNHTSFGMSGENWVKNCSATCPHFDAIVIDPPRSGMEKPVLDYLIKSNALQIISMSCDPATHARDLAKLIRNGYEIKDVYLLDFYPNTSHIESLVELRKKPD
ncbi:MAG: RsmD family RNA methyltransferase [Treponema sp.]|nr:RsmD family RNA methyltransferase [Treponema sp.]